MSPHNTGTTKIHLRSIMRSLVFMEDSKHLLSGGKDGMIRQWCIEDGREVGQAIKASSAIWMVALSKDCKWIVSGGDAGVATVWDRETRQSALTVSEHRDTVYAVDVSPDSTKFATGSGDAKVFIWDILTGRRLAGPLQHDDRVVSLRFSPWGDRIATTTCDRDSLRVYNVRNGELLRNIPIVSNTRNSIAWSGNSQHIYALSSGVLNQLHVNSISVRSKWTIPGETLSQTGSIALSSNDRFIAVFSGSSLSFWDPFTRRRLGSVIDHPFVMLRSIALSLDNKHVATGGEDGMIVIRHLDNVIPKSYLVGQPIDQQPRNRQGPDLPPPTGARRADGLMKTPTMINKGHKTVQAVSPRVSDGSYYIRNITSNAYLSCPRGPSGNVVVQPYDRSNVSQRWTISSVAGGTYSIVGRAGNKDVSLSTGNTNRLVVGVPSSGPISWTFGPQGDAYLIGNSARAVVSLSRSGKSVSVIPRNNRPNQLWVLLRAYN